MPKKTKYVTNPATGREVLADGAVGRAILAGKKKKAKKCSASGKHCSREWVPDLCTFPFKKAGKTKGYADRLSAAWAAPRGITEHFYAGKWHTLKYDCNGRPYWA